MTRTFILGLSAFALSVPAAAQKQQPTPEQRIDRLERQTRQIQRQVFPKGQPADTAGLDIVSFQDHPYQPSFLDTWTLLSVVAAETTHVRVAPNVANIPLRPPVMLARSAA